MTLFVKYDLDLLCKTLLKEQLDAQDISYSLGSLGEIHIEGKLSPEKQENLTAALKKYARKKTSTNHLYTI